MTESARAFQAKMLIAGYEISDAQAMASVASMAAAYDDLGLEVQPRKPVVYKTHVAERNGTFVRVPYSSIKR